MGNNKEEDRKTAWIERLEELVHVLEGSSVAELELSENELEIVIRRQPGMALVATPTVTEVVTSPATAMRSQSVAKRSLAAGQAKAGAGKGGKGRDEERTLPIVAPLSGVYYAAPSPDAPPFVSVGDVIQVGQTVALIEAMKSFNEVPSPVAGRVTKILVENGAVVQKDEVLIRVEPV
ncbi:biotin/lipoyl-containing protein [Thermogemmatispora sp.]|uniref:biotin/lipoyl-containing protein n=1 Tax=Thermogemmatispora sp. TaxID=1968838 RepID=UPI001D3DD425|nr:biotin/lipoyl-containing protein [Thermogemmatispora sp.]MBX5449399.1 biotin/lipoyl-binding protein [Thermogemmatispora sp.]